MNLLGIPRIKMAETMRFELMEGITLRTLSKGVV